MNSPPPSLPPSLPHFLPHLARQRHWRLHPSHRRVLKQSGKGHSHTGPGHVMRSSITDLGRERGRKGGKDGRRRVSEGVPKRSMYFSSLPPFTQNAPPASAGPKTSSPPRPSHSIFDLFLLLFAVAAAAAAATAATASTSRKPRISTY